MVDPELWLSRLKMHVPYLIKHKQNEAAGFGFEIISFVLTGLMQYYLVNELLNADLKEPSVPQIAAQNFREKINLAKDSEMIDIKEIKLQPCAYDKDSCYHDIF